MRTASRERMVESSGSDLLTGDVGGFKLAGGCRSQYQNFNKTECGQLKQLQMERGVQWRRCASRVWLQLSADSQCMQLVRTRLLTRTRGTAHLAFKRPRTRRARLSKGHQSRPSHKSRGPGNERRSRVG